MAMDGANMLCAWVPWTSAPPCGDPRALFYVIQSVLIILAWTCVYATGGGNIFEHPLQMYVATRPAWIPRRVLTGVLHQRGVYMTLCYTTPVMLLAAAYQPHCLPLRVAAAAVASAYALGEASITNWHKDHTMSLVVWAVALLPSDMAQGVTLGLTVNFVASSGFAKLWIGGQEWLSGDSLRAFLKTYGGYRVEDGGPGLPLLNRLFLRRPHLSRLASIFTLVVECVYAPATLLLLPPGPGRLGLVLAMLGLHLGIAAVQSVQVGVLFLPGVASYVLGLGAPLSIGSRGWCVAVAVAMGSLVWVLIRRRPLPETWPGQPQP